MYVCVVAMACLTLVVAYHAIMQIQALYGDQLSAIGVTAEGASVPVRAAPSYIRHLYSQGIHARSTCCIRNINTM